jgi:hypothetical protein
MKHYIDSGPLVYDSLIYANLNIHRSENFLIISCISTPNSVIFYTVLLLPRKVPVQQQEQYEPILWPIGTHDLQGILVGIHRHLQRLGNIDPD